ncbi:hypothetical protein DFH09DRAFT_1028804 [Mycena vulgaris]|nr:hypothetical protein DFH09DRAFT_1028804 [Mycena vulgaris]
MSLRNSPFAAKLLTNYAPSDEEVCEIRALLVEPVDELARIDAQIDETEAALAQLRVKRQGLQAEIDSYRALTSVVRRVPQDILQEIFLCCLERHWTTSVGTRRAPLLLGFICSYWRSVAHNMPSLWSGLHARWGMTAGHFSQPEHIDAWLSRAGSCPLSISIGLPLNKNGGVVPPRLRPLGAEDLPILTCLRIATDTDLDRLIVFQTPSLRHVFLDVVDPLRLPLVWERLTELTIGNDRLMKCFGGGIDFDGALEVLSRCKNLVRCGLLLPKYSQITARPTFALPHLEHLVLIIKDVHNLLEFIACLFLPNLRHLAMIVRDDWSPSSPPGGHHFVDLSLELFTQTTLLSLLALLPGSHSSCCATHLIRTIRA